MAKRAHRDSLQERAVTREPEEAPLGNHFVEYISPLNLKPGMRLVTQFKRTKEGAPAQALKTHTIKKDELVIQPRGCRGKVHVGNDCYDSVQMVPIASNSYELVDADYIPIETEYIASMATSGKAAR